MYYKDLSKYDYGSTKYPNALNVGWLDKEYIFPTGKFPEKPILLLVLNNIKPSNLYRGCHGCQFCNESGNGGNGEYIVQFKGRTYAAPTLIKHYITAHNYLPPQEFIIAVLNNEIKQDGTS